MADKKISQLTAVASLAGTESLPVVQSGTTMKATVNQVKATVLNSASLTSGYLPYWNGTNLVNSLVYQSGTDVMIGTTTAVSKFTVDGGGGINASYGIAHKHNAVELSTYIDGSGVGSPGAYIGTITNHPFYIFTNNGSSQFECWPDGTVRHPNQTANRAVYLGANKEVLSSAVTSTELGYVSGVTSAIQTQIDSKASVAYVDAAITGLLDLKGDQDCSANPLYPSASKGDAYYVTVAGKIGGASGKSVDIGDVYVAKADNAGGTEAAVGSSWFVLEHNLSGVVTTSDVGTVTNAMLAGSISYSKLAAMTSAELASIVSDETGSGTLVFSNAPTLVDPVVGTQSEDNKTTKAASTEYVDTKTIKAYTGCDATNLAASTGYVFCQAGCPVKTGFGLAFIAAPATGTITGGMFSVVSTAGLTGITLTLYINGVSSGTFTNSFRTSTGVVTVTGLSVAVTEGDRIEFNFNSGVGGNTNSFTCHGYVKVKPS